MKELNFINNQIEKIENIYITGKTTDQKISKYLIQKWKNKKNLAKINIIAKDNDVSISRISKFFSNNNLQPLAVFRFIFEINHLHLKKTNQEHNDNFYEAAQKIKKAKKILFMGQGNSAQIAKIFHTYLSLKGYHSVYLDGKIDQILMANELKKEDLIIVVSFSWSHIWSKEILKNKEVSIIGFSGNNNIKTKKNVIIFSEKNTNKLRYETQSFANISKIFITMEKIISHLS